tara:strand:+ start:791 stop:970 length:180 start_codon:yes stop_codon:yes gene_type:complete
MLRNKRLINELVRMYDNLLAIGEKNVGKKVKMGDYGTWTPSEKGLATIKSRRDKIYYGK